MNRIDFKINSLISYILQILVICSILCVLPVFQEILSVRLSERILALIGFCTCSIFFCRYHSLLDKVGWVYCISLLVISIVHTDMVTVENTFSEYFHPNTEDHFLILVFIQLYLIER